MQQRNRVLGAAACALLAGTAMGQVMGQAIDYQEIAGSQEFSGEMIVRPTQLAEHVGDGLSAEAAMGAMAAARGAVGGYQIKSYYPETDEYVILVPEGSSENAVANALMATGNFQYVEPNWILFALDTPNDPLLNSQWHHNANRMNSSAGWDIHTGEPSVTVAICDTGVQTNHPDLLLHRKEGYNATTQVWENDGGQIGPTSGHGTQTTGCAAANGDNGVGVAGVGWNLSHRMMRVSENGSSSTLEILTRAARVAVLERGDKVSNVSFSGVTSASIRTTATTIKNAGGLLVWSAGNNGANLNWGNRDNDDLIVVGATTSSDSLSGFSAFGPSMDLVAPGSSVFTTTTGSGYDAVSGTSFSAPLTAGMIGLIWSANPGLTPDEVEDILKAGCDDLGANGVDNTFGYGRIEILGSLSLVSNPVDFSFPDGQPDMLDPNGGTSIRVEIVSGDDDPVPGTGTLSYDDGSGFVTIAMQEVSNNVYDAVFPGLPCGNDVQYYFGVETSAGETATEPRGAPDSAFSAQAIIGFDTIVRDNMETTGGWTTENVDLEDGQWDRGVPVGGGDRGDPAQDFDGSGSAWLTDNVDDNSDVDGGPTRLISPAFDLDGMEGVVLTYARWFTNDDGDADRLTVEVSNNDGANWTMLESVGNSSGWVQPEFVLEDHIALSSQMRFRFSATDNPNDSVTEAGLDDFHLFMFDCGDAGCAADLDGDGDADADDFFAYLDLFAAGDDAADLDGDGDTDADDFFAYLDQFAAGC